MIIDAHQHFWRYSADEYRWIDQRMSILRRDFLPEDLKRCGVDAVISVQARQSLFETQWLLELAQAHQFIRGVVGWVPLIHHDIQIELERLAVNPKLRGMRHVLQDEPDDRYMLRDDFNRGVAMLERFNLRYDILIFERHLAQTIRFVDRHPKQIFILDHVAKPRIRDRQIDPWRKLLRELAQRPNVYCKISGMVTEADWKTWSPADLAPYFDAALEAFSPRRLMFASDWPVCLLASSYARWVQTVRQWAAPLSAAEQQRLFAATAIEAYGLDES